MTLTDANWDDLKFVLAVADAGSVNAAARKLNVNHATVLRRITHLEQATGAQIFDRTQEGYRPTRQGLQLIEGAARIREEMQQLDRTLNSRTSKLEGEIRITTTDTFVACGVGQALSDFQKAYPSITVELVVTNQLVSLSKKRADVAIRPTRNIPDGMTALRVCGVGFALFATREYLQTDPQAPSPQSRWLVIDTSNMTSPTEYWMRTHYPNALEVVRADTFVALTQFAELGQGLAILPCCLGTRCPGLIQIGAPLPDIETSLWVMTPNDIAGTALIDVFCRFMAKSLAERAPALEGRAPPADQ